jgi:hypothetical protein
MAAPQRGADSFYVVGPPSREPSLCLALGLRQASIQTVIVYIAGVNDYTLGAIFERALLREIIKIEPEAYARRAF